MATTLTRAGMKSVSLLNSPASRSRRLGRLYADIRRANRDERRRVRKEPSLRAKLMTARAVASIRPSAQLRRSCYHAARTL
jgi:hypothetical protein